MEVKAWTYRKGWKAPQCAGVIHTDFEKGFIRAEVIKYEDYIQYGSEAAVREAAAEANERARRALETELGDLGGTELSSLGLGSEKDLADRAEDTTPDTWRV